MSAPRWFSYQWMRNGTPIRGAVSASYTMQEADVGKVIAVNVTASNYAGSRSAYVDLASLILQGTLAAVESGDRSYIYMSFGRGTMVAVESSDAARFQGPPHGILARIEAADDATFAGTRT